MDQTLKIGGHRVKLTLKDFEGEDRCGDASYLRNEIRINKDLAQSQKEETLIHEVLHICNTEIDHVVLDSITSQLYAFLKDNHLLNTDRLGNLFSPGIIAGGAARLIPDDSIVPGPK